MECVFSGEDRLFAVNKVHIRRKDKTIEINPADLESRFQNIMRKAGEKYGIRLSGYSIYDDIKRLVILMRKYGITDIWTDGYGNVFTCRKPPKNVLEELRDLVYDIAWDIDCILINDFVSDVYVVPVFYKIKLEGHVLIIKHETMWENA